MPGAAFLDQKSTAWCLKWVRDGVQMLRDVSLILHSPTDSGVEVSLLNRSDTQRTTYQELCLNMGCSASSKFGVVTTSDRKSGLFPRTNSIKSKRRNN